MFIKIGDFWTRIATKKQKCENVRRNLAEIINAERCTPFSRLPQARLMRLDSFFSGALCVLSGGRLPEALFMVFYWIPKVQ